MDSELTRQREIRRVSALLISLGDKIRSLQTMVELAEHERRDLIDEALSLKIRKRDIAKLLGVSEGRVHQIIKPQRKRVPKHD